MIPTQRIRLAVGTDDDFSYQTPNRDGSFGGIFASSDPISARLWAGDSTVPLATPTAVWGSKAVSSASGASQTLWTVQFVAADTAALTPGRYRLQVTATHSGRKAILWDGLVDLGDAPGTSIPTDLITVTFAESALTRLHLSRPERDFLPTLVTIASDTIQKWCGERDFTRQTYTEEHTVQLDGMIALRQYPVNTVGRIRGCPLTVLAITASPSTYQQAWVSYTSTGDWATGTLTFTGITLNWVASGVAGSTALTFAANPTVGALATAAGQVAGWRAITAPIYSEFPSTDLSAPGGLTAQGAMDLAGAQLAAYTQDLALTSVDNKTGFLWVGRYRASGNWGPRWGEDWEALEVTGGGPIGRVQVTYDAGFTVIPTPVQAATAELTKALVERFRGDHQLISESVGGAGSRAYEVAEKLVGMLPKTVLQALSLYRRIGVR